MTLLNSSTLLSARDTDVKDRLSFILGMISIVSWTVAEIPQLITNYKEKSAEGISFVFLTMWTIGDLFNLFGCLMEPATLPTQYYTALLYTLITVVLFAQAIYYSHIYKPSQMVAKQKQTEPMEKSELSNSESFARHHGSSERWTGRVDSPERENTFTSPITLPNGHRRSFPGSSDLYYTSARSLSSSYTPPAGSFFHQMMTSHTTQTERTFEEPLLRNGFSEPASPPTTKAILCVASVFMFLGHLCLHRLESSNISFDAGNQGYVMQATRKLLQVTSGHSIQNGTEGSDGVGTYLGWAMAAIYMGGRLPQICLNIRRGNAEGLNPLMFLFALVGNSTYVASILMKSTEWSRIRPNLPWLVDAVGCVMLDSLILIQFICFRCWSNRVAEHKQEIAEAA